MSLLHPPLIYQSFSKRLNSSSNYPKRMNIAIFTDCFLPTKNGVATSIAQLKEGLEQRGHTVMLLTVKTPHDRDDDPTIYRFPAVPFNSSIEIRMGLVNQQTVNRIVQEAQIDLIHTHTEFSLGWAAKRAARRLRVPLVHTAHTMYDAYRHYLFFGKLISTKMIQRWWQWFLRGYEAVICPSIKAQQYFAAFLPAFTTVVIGNGVCPTRFHPARLTSADKTHARSDLGIAPSDKVILYVGRIAPEKRVVELVNLLTPLLQTHPQYKAVLVGCGALHQALIEAAERHRIRQQVILTGYVDWERMPALYLIAQVFVTASLSEIHPMTVIEAAMCGLPIIARRDASYTELIEDGYNGYLTDSDEQLAGRVARILEDDAALQTFSQHGRIISARFTAESHVKKCEALYRQVIERHLHSQ